MKNEQYHGTKKLTKETSFHQEDKRLKEILNMPMFRTLTCIEDKERCYRKVEQDKLKRYCIDNYGLNMNPDKTARSNRIRIIGNKSKKEYFNESNNISEKMKKKSKDNIDQCAGILTEMFSAMPTEENIKN